MTTEPNSNDTPLAPDVPAAANLPEGIDRRSFLVRNAVIGAAAVMTARTWTPEARGRTSSQGSRRTQAGFQTFSRP
jgi:L-serine dehydratase